MVDFSKKKSNESTQPKSKSARPERKTVKTVPTPPRQRAPRDRNTLKKVSKEERLAQVRKQRLLIGIIFIIIAILLAIFVIVTSHSKKNDNSNTSSQQRLADSNEIDTSNPGENTASPSELLASPTPAPPVSITVSVVGDCTLGTDEYFNYDTSLNNYFDTYGAEYFLQNVQDIFSSDDLTIANFEGVLTDLDTRADKQFAFKAPASFAQILSSGSVEAVTLANNHSHDYGEQSFEDTKSALDAENITHFGYEETAVVDVKGIQVGLVGIYELNDHLDCAQLMKDNIAAVKAEGADLVIVIFHWGNEKETMPDSNQTTLGRMAIDEGADLVCGHHSHVLQGMESYKGKYILYSLGNFCFGGNSYPSDMDTIIYQQTFTIHSEGVEATDDIRIIPCSISSDYGYNNYQPTPSTGDEATRILQKFEERSSWIQPSES